MHLTRSILALAQTQDEPAHLSFSTRVAAAALAASEPRARRVWASASRASSADTCTVNYKAAQRPNRHSCIQGLHKS
eukprot:1136169-Pelagomonas_calceolata.AAC.1